MIFTQKCKPFINRYINIQKKDKACNEINLILLELKETERV